jgi:hypothetical protein
VRVQEVANGMDGVGDKFKLHTRLFADILVEQSSNIRFGKP